jgi:cold-inducible RNA-binding protein
MNSAYRQDGDLPCRLISDQIPCWKPTSSSAERLTAILSRAVASSASAVWALAKENVMNLYVGNLHYRMTEDQLKETFEEYGQVSSCTIIKDKVTGSSKGFGFLEMPERSEAEAAITGLNGRELMGRKLNVNEARPRTEGGAGGGRSAGGGWGGGGGGGRGARDSGGGGGRDRW